MELGIQCSVLKGFPATLAEAVDLGCEAMQMLPYRRNHPPSGEQTAAFKEARAASSVRRLIVHSRFVPSLGSSDERRRLRSVEHLARELRLARDLGAEGFILHAGAYSVGERPEKGFGFVVESVIRAHGEAGCSLPVYIENVPGGGRRMGATLEEMARYLESLGPSIPGMGICLDTAHAWAAGYDLSGAEGMLKFLARAHRLIGADNVKVFHLNETRAMLGSHQENHWHWGEGFIGPESLRTLLDRPEYAGTVGIIENPRMEGAGRKNLEYVRKLRD